MRSLNVIFFASLIVAGETATALPEYSARYGINSCTACHESPVGGGPRNINGKLFGAHGYKINPFLVQDYVSADFRALFYYPEHANETKSGMGIMSGSVAGHVALDEEKKIHLVIESNVAGFQQAMLRDTYALYKFSTDERPAWFESLLVGRFRAPFGIITDEHRTYTRIQSGTEWFSMEAGALLSGQTGKANLHYDLAWLNGENTGGQSIAQNGAGRWGTVLNLRYMPGPAMFGASYSYHRHDPKSESRTAASFYTVVSVARWSDGKIPLTVELEHVRATNWGGNLGRGFINDPGYAASLTSTQSYGYLAQVIWDLSHKFSWIYKFDWLVPDQNFPSDFYQRHGLGLRYWFGPNAWLQVRTEVARASPPSEVGGQSLGAQNASFAILQLSF
ncbi:MAG: hypothetical protein ACXVA9_07190 [Bdellovibrionales bacterium]